MKIINLIGIFAVCFILLYLNALRAENIQLKDLKEKIVKALKNTKLAGSEKYNLISELAAYPSAETVRFCFGIVKAPVRFESKKDKDPWEEFVKKQNKRKKKFQDEIKKLNDELKLLQAMNKLKDKKFASRLAAIELRRSAINKKLAEIDNELGLKYLIINSVVEVLSKLTAADTRGELLKGLSDKNWQVVVASIKAIEKQKWEAAFSKIALIYPINGEPHKNNQVRVCAIQALRELDVVKGKKIFIKALEDKNWLVRFNAVLALGRIGDKDSIESLITQIEKESGRLQWDIVTIIKNLTGKNFGTNIKNWKEWWNKNKEEFKPKKVEGEILGDVADTEGSHQTGSFYGIPLASAQTIFIVDQSGSMQAAADSNLARKQLQEWMKKNPKSKGIPPIKPPKGHKSKWEVVQRKTINAINALTKNGLFNIIFYSTDIKVYKPAELMVPATGLHKEKAFKTINKRRADGLTNIYGALKKAFELATGWHHEAGGIWTKDGNAKLHADTFFFMTDGSPTTGKTTDTDEILKAVKKWNKNLGIRINTIGIGMCVEKFLKDLAKQNYGKFLLHDKEPK